MTKNISHKKRKPHSDSGFTLVELIVVLVILAVLAAILSPALLGYIDRAREKKDILKAKSCITATQAELSNQYALHEPGDDSVISNYSGGSNGDMFVANSDFAKKILKTADDNPYILIVGMGHYPTYKNTDIHKAYTVYFAAYVATSKSDAIFFNGTKWCKEYPWVKDGANDFMVNGEKIKLQFYILAAPKNNSEVWTRLRERLAK